MRHDLSTYQTVWTHVLFLPAFVYILHVMKFLRCVDE